MMEEKSASNIPVDNYVPGNDFDEWLKCLEDAVVLATKVTDGYMSRSSKYFKKIPSD